MGNILAVDLAAPNSQNPEDYRCILAVTSIVSLVQTTRLYGNSMFMLGHNVGALSDQQRFQAFIASLNRPMTWAELTNVPLPPQLVTYPGMPAGNLLAGYPNRFPQPGPPDAQGTLTAIGAGYDTMKLYWVEFKGNYDLVFPIFRNRTVTRLR